MRSKILNVYAQKPLVALSAIVLVAGLAFANAANAQGTTLMCGTCTPQPMPTPMPAMPIGFTLVGQALGSGVAVAENVGGRGGYKNTSIDGSNNWYGNVNLSSDGCTVACGSFQVNLGGNAWMNSSASAMNRGHGTGAISSMVGLNNFQQIAVVATPTPPPAAPATP